MDAAALIPLTVMALLVTVDPGSPPVCAGKVNTSGVVSAALMVMETVSVSFKLPSLTVNSNVSDVLALRFGAVNEAVALLASVRGTVGEPAV